MPERKGHGTTDKGEYYATTPDSAYLGCEYIDTNLPNLLKMVVNQPKTVLNPRHYLEPTCGSGIWMEQMRRRWPHAVVKGVELDPDLAQYGRNLGLDVETGNIMHVKHPVKYDVIAGNPPFSLAKPIIAHLLDECLAPGGVAAFYLRLGFLETPERAAWFSRSNYHLAAVFPMAQRPGFTPDGGTDGTSYGLFCWVKGYEGPTLMEHFRNEDIEVRWSQGRREKKDEAGNVVAPAVLDPRFPDPRKVPQPVIRRARGEETTVAAVPLVRGLF